MRTSYRNLLRALCFIMCMILVLGLSACKKGKVEDIAFQTSSHEAVASPASIEDVGQKKLALPVKEVELSETDTNSSPEASVPSERFVAIRHFLVIETPAKKMQVTFDSTISFCRQVKCQVFDANYTRETSYNPPSASLFIRIPPQSMNAFMAELEKNGNVLQHQQESENKTNAVIDTEARIKNLTELRDKLRLMLNNHSANFKDVIEVTRELTHTQEQLDSINGIRKVLAQETELVAVNIDFRAEQHITESSFFAPVIHALSNAGETLIENLAEVITFVLALLPWLLLVIPLIVLIRKLWLKMKTKKS